MLRKCGELPLGKWQLAKLRETLQLAQNSLFHRNRVYPVETLEDFRNLPFTDQCDIIREGMRMICVPQSDISRIVTLRTSGTTNAPKRIHFTAEDIELTVDFFAGGLPTVVEPGGVMAVMLPCKTPDGVGDLICRGLRRIPVKPVQYGLLDDFSGAARMLAESGAQAVVGVPVQVLALIRYLEYTGQRTALRSVLLSTDNVPDVLVKELEGRGIEVYKHLGLTETGLGCAIDCDAHMGMHIRGDLLLEIIDPDTGLNLPDGSWGEIVVTTLTRRGMPMIRYRTGDFSRMLPGVCPCGSSLRRLDDIRGRIDGGISLSGGVLTMPDLDEALLALPQVMDFRVTLCEGLLQVEIAAFDQLAPLKKDDVHKALDTIPAVRNSVGLNITVEIIKYDNFQPLHQGKRVLIQE